MSNSTAICDPAGNTECPRFRAHGAKTCRICSMLAFCARGSNDGKEQPWYCIRCGLGNVLKYCSNCGEERS